MNHPIRQSFHPRANGCVLHQRRGGAGSFSSLTEETGLLNFGRQKPSSLDERLKPPDRHSVKLFYSTIDTD